MNKGYFVKELKNAGMWEIFVNQTMIKDPEEFFDEMRQRPMIEETRDALSCLLAEGEENLEMLSLTGNHHYFQELIIAATKMLICLQYLKRAISERGIAQWNPKN